MPPQRQLEQRMSHQVEPRPAQNERRLARRYLFPRVRDRYLVSGGGDDDAATIGMWQYV